MSKISLLPVRYYDVNEIYCSEVDNRPIFDISNNVDIINTQLARLGFYKEVKADPQMEPAGGFTPYYCGYIGENGLLYPIDVSISPLDLNLAKYEIVLVIEKVLDTYKTITFSSEFTIPGRFNSFLPDSVGRAIKIGPGGSLVDELAFDLYYSTANLQSVIVGKILSATSISFGGNQVSTLGNNRFIRKDTNDSTTGLTTTYRSNIESSVVSRGVVTNSVASAYPFAEIQVSANNNPGTNVLSLEEAIPVYLTNKSLNLDPVTGIFTDTSFESRLNELHVRTSVVSALSDDITKTRTAVVNTGALLDFASTYTLHSDAYSLIVGEETQSLSTNLKLVPKSTLHSSLLSIEANTQTLGVRLDSDTGLPENLVPIASAISTLRGLALGGYSDISSTSGSFIGVIQDVASETSLVDSTTSLKMSEMTGSSSLLIYSKQTSSTNEGAANIFLVADGYMGLYARGGIHVAKTPELDTELANKAYVDLAISSIMDNSAKKLTLLGNTSSDPLTSSLFFDVSNSLEPNVALKLTGLTSCDALTNNPVAFKQLASPASYQTVRADTPSSGTNNDLVNRLFLVTYVTTAISGALSGIDNPVALNSAQTITGVKTFNVGQIFSASTPFTVAGASAGSTSKIDTTNLAFLGIAASGTIKAKIKIKDDGVLNKTTDTSDVLANKGYVDTQIGILAGTIPSSLAQEYAFWDSRSHSDSDGIMKNTYPVSGNRSTTFSSLFAPFAGTGIFNNISEKTITIKIEFNGTFRAVDGYASAALKIRRAGSAVDLTDAEVTSGTNSTGNTLASDRQNPQGVLALNKICKLSPGDSFFFDSNFYPADSLSNALGSFNSWGSLIVLSVQ